MLFLSGFFRNKGTVLNRQNQLVPFIILTIRYHNSNLCLAKQSLKLPDITNCQRKTYAPNVQDCPGITLIFIVMGMQFAWECNH